MIRVADIQAAVAEHYRIPRRVMRDRSQARFATEPRAIAIFLARRLTTHSLCNIGRMFGGRHSSTVFHAIKAAEHRIATKEAAATSVLILRERLSGGSAEWMG